MRNQRTLDLVYLALFTTIIIIMTQVPWLGFIPLGVTTATIVHIPVIIASVYLGKKLGVLTGLIFGLLSWITAYIRPNNVMDLFFQNPLISVVPRVLFAYVTFLIYQGLRGIKNEYIRLLWTSFFASLSHSVLVISSLLLVYFNKTKTFTMSNGEEATLTITFAIIGLVLIVSILAEAIVSGIITPPVVKALRTSRRGE